MSEPMEKAAFRDLAIGRYSADRFATEDQLDAAAESHGGNVDKTKDYFRDATVVLQGRCVCDRPLFGLLGSFAWGLVNGLGQCAHCGAQYQLYHRLDGLFFQMPMLIGLPEPKPPAG